jgi:hypothetical protein
MYGKSTMNQLVVHVTFSSRAANVWKMEHSADTVFSHAKWNEMLRSRPASYIGRFSLTCLELQTLFWGVSRALVHAIPYAMAMLDWRLHLD